MSENQVVGVHAVDLLLKKSADQIIKIYLQANRKDKRGEKILAMAARLSIPVVRWPKEKLDAMSSDNHQGIIAEVRAGSRVKDENQLYDLVSARNEPVLLLILDGVTDPHNLGACLRTADACGVAGVVVPKDRAVGLNATVRKVACGAAETIPFFAVTNLVRAIKTLQDLGVWVIGTAGEAEQYVHQARFNGPMALVMGAEEKGMRRLTREHCDELVKIPMLGSVSSLNVSVATGVCLYEIVRQKELDSNSRN